MTGYESKRAAARDKLAMTKDEALKLALEVLEELQGGCTDHDDGTVEAITVWCPEVISAIKEALAQPAQEPPQYSFKAYWAEDGRIGVVGCIIRPDGNPHILEEFIDPPQPAQEPVVYEFGCSQCGHTQNEEIDISQRPWVDLTDEQVRSIAKPLDDTEIPMTGRMWIFVGDLMDKLKEKNT